MVPSTPPPLIMNQLHSEIHVSVEGDQISRLAHISTVPRDDNQKVYHFLEEETRGTVYALDLKPHQCTKNGRATFKTLCEQHDGIDK